MKKYLRFGCTVCQRTVDKQVDNVRVIPDKCTITLNCQGRLLPIEYRSNADIAVAPAVGIADWYARGKTVTPNAVDSTVVFIDTSTGSTRQLVLAVQLSAPPSVTATASLALNVRADTPKSYRQYSYRYDTNFSTVSGVETAIEKKTLRFTAYGVNADLVEVYLDGVQQTLGTGSTEFQVYDGANSVPPNMISFNSPVIVSGTRQVDVIVSKVQAQAQNTLSFFKNIDNPARLSTGAWENVDSFTRFVGGSWKSFYLFTYDVSSTVDLDLNTVLTPSGSVLVNDTVSTAIPLSECYFMLAREPYSILDRYPDVSARLDVLTNDRDYLKFYPVNSIATLGITETALEAFYPPARLVKFTPELTIKTTLAGVTDQLVVDGKVIVGPDT